MARVPEGFAIKQGQINHRYVHTFAELDALASGNNLVPGANYKMSDYVTKHAFTNDSEVIHTATVEPIILTAISTSEFYPLVQSETYPTHIISYDFTNVTCEDSLSTPRNGLITERYDPEKNTRTKFDFIGCKYRLFEITGKEYHTVSKSTDSLVTVTIPGTRPNISTSNQQTYEFSFDTMTHPAGQITIELTYSNFVETRKLLYYLDQTPTGEIPENYLSGKKCTAVYNPELDAFVLMSFRDIGVELIGTFSSPFKDTYSIGRGNVRYTVDNTSFEDYNVFQGLYNNINIPGGFSGDPRPGAVFKGNAYDVDISESLTRSVFTKNISGFKVGRSVDKLLCDSQETNHTTITYISDVLLLNSGFSFYYVDHRFQTLSRATITPCANMYMEAVDLVIIIFEKSGAFTSTAPIQLTNIFVTGQNIGTTPNAFKISGTLLRSLVGYFDAQNLQISKTLVDITMYQRDMDVKNTSGGLLVDSLTFNQEVPDGVGTTTLLSIDENNKVVKGASGSSSGFVTLDTDQEITGRKDFPANGFRFVPDGGLGRRYVSFRSVSTIGPEEILFTPVFYIDGNYNIAMTKGNGDGSGWNFLINPTAFRSYTFKDESGTVAFLSDITPAKIVEYLSSIVVEEDKLPNSAIQGTPVNSDQFIFTDVLGVSTLFIRIDTIPTLNSKKFLNSGSLYNYFKNITPGFAPTFTQTGDAKDISLRRIVGKNGVFYACSSDGTGNRFYTSVDGRFFIPCSATGSLEFYSFDVSDQGTVILAARTGGPGNLRRSTDKGLNFATITLAGTYEVTSIRAIGAGRWVLCARTGEALYSTDDGATWSAATVDGANAFQGIGYGNGVVFMVSDDGIDRFQISTDFGVTYTAKNLGPDRPFRGGLFFNGNIVIRRGGDSTGGYITISSNNGDTWTEKLIPAVSTQSISGMSIIGDYLYLYGENGYIIRTKDLDTYDQVTSGTTNTISAMAMTNIDGSHVIMYGCDTGTGDRIFSSLP